MATTFSNDDASYERWIAQHPSGYVINTYSPPAPSYLMLHRANCHYVSGTPPRGRHWTAGYTKICAATAAELLAEASRIGGAPTRCKACAP
jgi:hypothetical protein